MLYEIFRVWFFQVPKLINLEKILFLTDRTRAQPRSIHASWHELSNFETRPLGCILAWSSFAQSFNQTALIYRASIEFSSALALMNTAPPTASWSLAGHLEASYDFGSGSVNLMLDPSLRLNLNPSADLGLGEAYLEASQDDFELRFGVERLPLEVARLSLPFGIETSNDNGSRRGLLGVRATWSPPLTRLRLALLEDHGRVLPVLSLRREFGALELEVHGLYQFDRLILGIGGSGTLESIVIYGEIWALLPTGATPFEWRYALGATGNLEAGRWTLEFGYASPRLGTPVRQLLTAAFTLPQGEDASWSFQAAVFFDPDAVRGQGGIGYSVNLNESLLTMSFGVQFGLGAPIWVWGLNVKFFP